MLWIVILFVFVYLLFQDSCQTCQDELEGFLPKIAEDYQSSKSDDPPITLKDHYKNPEMNCPDNYERTQDNMHHIQATTKYYGYTGEQHKYIDDRFIDWSKLKEPLPVYGDFFM